MSDEPKPGIEPVTNDSAIAFNVQGPTELLVIRVDGSILWCGQLLDTAPEVGRALREFVESQLK